MSTPQVFDTADGIAQFHRGCDEIICSVAPVKHCHHCRPQSVWPCAEYAAARLALAAPALVEIVQEVADGRPCCRPESGCISSIAIHKARAALAAARGDA